MGGDWDYFLFFWIVLKKVGVWRVVVCVIN